MEFAESGDNHKYHGLSRIPQAPYWVLGNYEEVMLRMTVTRSVTSELIQIHSIKRQ